MKIGEFAQKFDTKKSTIRFYTEKHLLLPKLNGTYPDYDEQCLVDMEHIQLLKNMGFSIDEILKLKSKERLFVTYTPPHRSHLDEILEKKIEEHRIEIHLRKKMINEIAAYKSKMIQEKQMPEIGFPFEALPLLECPKCHRAFTVNNASIQGTQIVSGSLSCSCGLSYQIIDGILVQTQITDSFFESRPLEELDISNLITNEHMAQMKNCGTELSSIIKTWDHKKGIIFLNADTDILMMQLNEIFVEDGLYIFCSSEYTSLNLLRRKMSTKDCKGNLVFLCLGDDIPLIDSIPYMVDIAGNVFDTITGSPVNTFTKVKRILPQGMTCLLLGLDPFLTDPSNMQAYLNLYDSAGFYISSSKDLGIMKALGSAFSERFDYHDLFLRLYQLNK